MKNFLLALVTVSILILSFVFLDLCLGAAAFVVFPASLMIIGTIVAMLFTREKVDNTRPLYSRPPRQVFEAL